MKIVEKVIAVDQLEGHINNGEVPLAVCPPKDNVSNIQKALLSAYYNVVVDKRGLPAYYCNIIDYHKCADAGYESIKFADGREEEIKGFTFSKDKRSKGKFVLKVKFESGKSMSTINLVKGCRLTVEKAKAHVNNKENTKQR